MGTWLKAAVLEVAIIIRVIRILKMFLPNQVKMTQPMSFNRLRETTWLTTDLPISIFRRCSKKSTRIGIWTLIWTKSVLFNQLYIRKGELNHPKDRLLIEPEVLILLRIFLCLTPVSCKKRILRQLNSRKWCQIWLVKRQCPIIFKIMVLEVRGLIITL